MWFLISVFLVGVFALSVQNLRRFSVQEIHFFLLQTRLPAQPVREADLQTLIEESADIEWVGEQAVRTG